MLTDLQIRELYNSGETIAGCARAAGCSPTKAYGLLKRAGVEFRSRGLRTGQRQPPGHAEHTRRAKLMQWAMVYGVLPQPKSVRDLRRHHYARFRAAVLRRDGHRCSECGATKRLEVHHIVPVIVNPSLALEPSNGVVLCFDCHRGVSGVHRAD